MRWTFALLFAMAIGWTSVFEPKVHEAFSNIGSEALRHGFLTTLASGIFAGWLIALMVWMMPASGGNQVLVISIPTYLIGLAGFAHIIVGSVENGSPAARAGIRPQDIIVRGNDAAVASGGDLRRLLRSLTPGATVRLEVVRPSGRTTIPVQLGQAPTT